MARKTRFIKIDPASTVHGRIDTHRVDATTEEEIEAQIIEDEKEADAEFLKNTIKATLIPPK
jgi:hypothetical protein